MGFIRFSFRDCSRRLSNSLRKKKTDCYYYSETRPRPKHRGILLLYYFTGSDNNVQYNVHK